MKPKNKLQKQVVEASKTLPKLTKTQIQWGYDHVIQYVGRRTDKGIITCTKCGHESAIFIWTNKSEQISLKNYYLCPKQ